MARITNAEAEEKLADWLADPRELGGRPCETEVLWRKTVPWPGGKQRIFLIRWRLADGTDGIGFAGPATWSFFDIPVSGYERLAKEDRLKRIANLYGGWYHCLAARQHGDGAVSTDPDEDIAFAESVCERRGMPFEGLSTVESMAIGEANYHVFRGIYPHERLGPTDRFLGIARRRKSKTAQLHRHAMVYGDWFADTPVLGRLPLFHFVGTILGPCAESFDLGPFGLSFKEDYAGKPASKPFPTRGSARIKRGK